MAPMPPQERAPVLSATSEWIVAAVKTGVEEAAVTGWSSRRRILRLPAA
jgi:hypothetical protein